MTDPIHLDVYCDLDTATGIWTIDVPAWWIIGERHGGSLHEAIAAALADVTLDRYQIHVHDLAGSELHFSH